jgi:L-ascorbate metabolism protein UlaG (beta-lactamase superfamily)
VIEPALSDEAFLADVRGAGPGVHLWWLGQAGYLVAAGGRHLLVDPYLSDSLTAKYAGTDTPHVRMTGRVVAPEELAFVDVVLSTHEHTDHLDAETLQPILRGGAALLVCPAGTVDEARERGGVEPTPIREGATVEVAGFHVEAVPAEHPGPHCVGYVLTVDGLRIYHSGDTTAVPDVPPVEVAILPINGKLGNMDGVTAARAARRIGAGLAIPCHYAMFRFNTASTREFTAECRRLKQPSRVLRAGERLTL